MEETLVTGLAFGHLIVLLLFGATETYYGVLPLTLQRIISYYYNIFFTTRNFLFFGLFYVVLGYYLGSKKQVYASYCLEKLLISIMLLVFEALLLQGTERLNSNILLACVPVTYYLFVCTIYLSNHHQNIFRLGNCQNIITSFILLSLYSYCLSAASTSAAVGGASSYSACVLWLVSTHKKTSIAADLRSVIRKRCWPM